MSRRQSSSSIVPPALVLAGVGAVAAGWRGELAAPISMELLGEQLAALAFSFLFLRRFMDSRDLRGLVGAPERQRVVSSSSQWFIDGRRN